MDKQATSRMKRRNNGRDGERGFSLVEILIVVAITGIVSTFALIGITRSRDYVRLQGSGRQLASYIEKARLDAIRRHTTTSVTFTNTSTYSVTMDFDGTGTVGTRSFPLESGVSIISTPLPSITFNWRGRTLACTTTFAFQNSSGEQSWVDVSDAGDVTVNNDVDVLPTVSYANVNSTADVVTGTIVSGTGVRNNTADCGGSGSSSTTIPITGTGSSGCSMMANPSALSIKKNGGSTGTVTVSTTGSGTFNITPSGPSNLQITPTSKTVAAGGSATFSITSLNTTRSTFAVNFSSSCTTVTAAVKVTN